MAQPDTALLRQAIGVSGLSARAFAALLEVDERSVRKWLGEERRVPGTVRVVCRAIVRDPAIVASLTPDPP